MTANGLDEQITKYLTDAHSIEVQALEQMKRAPDLAGDAAISQQFSHHQTETEQHERMVRQRLEELGARPATLKDVAGKMTGIGFALFAKLQPDTPGKLVAHAFSYEHMELAAYDLLNRVAELAGDVGTATLAREIAAQERAMAERLEADFDRAAEAALRQVSPDDIGQQLDKYLADAHAIEAQAIQLLDKGSSIAGSTELSAAFAEHLNETHEHESLVKGRLEARGASASKLKDAGLSLGALNWGGFFGAQPDTPAKLAGFSYAFEHLEIASYELLRRVAHRAGDADTIRIADQILAQERAAARRIRSLFEPALEAALGALGVGAAR
jgi:ferritin-like metal-binding protein YciE